MGRRNEHSRGEIREMTIDKAEDLVRREGRQVLTARHLMAEIGYTAGTLYQVFEGLEDVVHHVNLRTLTRLTEELSTAVQNQDSPSDHLLAFSVAYAGFAQREYHLWRLAFEHPPSTETEVGIELQGCLDRIQQILAEILHLTSNRMSEAEVQNSATAFLGGVHGTCAFTLNFHPDHSDITLLRHTVEGLAKPFVKGIEILGRQSA
ncbi:MAG: WHG domain-containing protein [Thiotrichales bacterium]